ncbi:MAG: SRPBCC domain-containing protein [Chloroflexales bacterium]|nr:SRPBCC domain-containing protein [Chloroflexales bacterium]
MQQPTVERSIWIDAPRERVWQAVTDTEQLAQWFLPPTLGAQMKRDEDGTTFVLMGDMAIPVAVLEAADPPRQAISRTLPDRLLATTYRLAEENGGTRVTVSMTGFELLPDDARQDRVLPSGLGWEKALANLKAHVAGAELPFPEGYVAALFGYRRKAKETIAVERSIWIAAPRERVWRAVTDPALIEQWFSPGTSWTLSAPKIGGRLFVRNVETGAEMYTQVIELLDPPTRLATRTVPEGTEPTHLSTYTLAEEKGGTRLTFTYTIQELEPDGEQWAFMEQSAFGFGMMLENVRALVEGASLPYPGGF